MHHSILYRAGQFAIFLGFGLAFVLDQGLIRLPDRVKGPFVRFAATGRVRLGRLPKPPVIAPARLARAMRVTMHIYLLVCLGLLAATLCLVLLSYAAHAQEWRPITRQCAVYAERQHPGCADCAPWQWLAACTAKNYYPHPVPPQQLAQCIGAVAAQRGHACAACGDPVRDVMDCLAGGR